MLASVYARAPHRRSVALLLFAAVLALESTHSGYQTCSSATCFPTAHNVADPTLDVYLLSTASCSVDGVPAEEGLENGTSVRSGSTTNISHGGRSSVVGQYCMFRGCSGPNCVTYEPENRNVSTISRKQYAPGGGLPTSIPLRNENTPPYLQIIDSDNAMTNGPVIWGADAQGTYTYKTNVITTATRCNITPTTHPEQSRSVNVMACKPEWFWDPNNSMYVRGPLENVKLNVPLGMEDVLEEALAAANSMTELGAMSR